MRGFIGKRGKASCGTRCAKNWTWGRSDREPHALPCGAYRGRARPPPVTNAIGAGPTLPPKTTIERETPLKTSTTLSTPEIVRRPPLLRQRWQSPRRVRTRRGDAITQLSAEHGELRLAFERATNVRLDPARRHELLCELCMTLRIHMLLEEEILYPAVRRVMGADIRTDTAQARHDAAKPLLAQLVDMQPGQPGYDAAVAALGEYIRQHIAQEQGEVFPRVRCVDLNLRTLARRMQERKQVLTCGMIVLGEVLVAAL